MSHPHLPPFEPGGEERWSGESQGWLYKARRIDGSGVPGPWLVQELPLRDVLITDVLSGPQQLKATIDPVYAWLQADDGDLLLQEWSTEIYAEADGLIRASVILESAQFQGSQFTLEGSGTSRYAKGRPYNGEQAFVETDPLDIVRHVWEHIQADEYSNVGLQVDVSTTTDKRVGKALEPVEDGTQPATASQEDGPFVLNSEEITDLGGLVDELAKATPFDYIERDEWNDDKTEVLHFLDFGWPRLGARRHDVRFVYGENMHTAPVIERDGSKFANYVRVFGAGEGSEGIRADAQIADGRLRRYVTIDDDSIGDRHRAQIRARRELITRNNITNVRSATVRNTGNLPLGAVRPGDEVRVQAELDWLSLDQWNRVVSIGINPDNLELMTFGLVRSDS